MRVLGAKNQRLTFSVVTRLSISSLRLLSMILGLKVEAFDVCKIGDSKGLKYVSAAGLFPPRPLNLGF